jgi:hypothetical protein
VNGRRRANKTALHHAHLPARRRKRPEAVLATPVRVTASAAASLVSLAARLDIYKKGTSHPVHSGIGLVHAGCARDRARDRQQTLGAY